MAKPGQKRRVTDEELIEVIRESSEPVLRASEVAEEVSIGRRGVANRLDNLLDKSSLHKKKLGNVVMYYLPAEGIDNEDTGETDESPKFSELELEEQFDIIHGQLRHTFDHLNDMDDVAQKSFRLALDMYIAEYNEELGMTLHVPDIDAPGSDAQSQHWEDIEDLLEGEYDPDDTGRDENSALEG